MTLLDKLLARAKDNEDTPDELTTRLEEIYAKAQENYTGEDTLTDFGVSDDPVIPGYEVEYLEGDVQELTAEWMLAQTNWELEDGPKRQDPDALVLEPRSRDKEVTEWDEATHTRKNSF